MTDHPLVIIRYEWGYPPAIIHTEAIPHAMLWSTILMLFNENQFADTHIKILAVIDARTDTVII